MKHQSCVFPLMKLPSATYINIGPDKNNKGHFLLSLEEVPEMSRNIRENMFAISIRPIQINNYEWVIMMITTGAKKRLCLCYSNFVTHAYNVLYLISTSMVIYLQSRLVIGNNVSTVHNGSQSWPETGAKCSSLCSLLPKLNQNKENYLSVVLQEEDWNELREALKPSSFV